MWRQQVTDLEQTLQDIGQSKVRSQLLISDVELGLSQPFSPEADIPLLQLLLESLHACKTVLHQLHVQHTPARDGLMQ